MSKRNRYGSMKMKRIFLKYTLWRRIYAMASPLGRRIYQVMPRSLFTNQFPGVAGRIHTYDNMLHPISEITIQHYVQVGLSAMSNIEESLLTASLSYRDINSCLDFPCGYGRVLRWLQTKIDAARITACDLDKQAVDFCCFEFGAKPLYSKKEFKKITFPQKYDLIWVGSLLTHLEPDAGWELLKVLAGALETRGLLIFTTQGEECVNHLTAYSEKFRGLEDRLSADLARRGVCYTPYHKSGDYGIAIHSPKYIEANMAEVFSPSLRPLRFKPRGWSDHQDVWTYQRM